MMRCCTFTIAVYIPFQSVPDHTVETTTLFDITVVGTQMTLTTYDGITVKYNGVYNVYVTIPCKYL